ncbi:hypothetical protein TNCV_3430271 [Trichonephila clavipes]|nr:hypothetical protein TNCV_3430271 [Trichonephila clavipes]
MLKEDQSADEVKSAPQAGLKEMDKNGFQICFYDLYKPWQKFTITQESYFEGSVPCRWGGVEVWRGSSQLMYHSRPITVLQNYKVRHQ